MTTRPRPDARRPSPVVLTCMLAGSACLIPSSRIGAHHSYAMFDLSTTLTVTGTVAKLERINPHVFVWVHVRNPGAAGGYDLYGLPLSAGWGLS